MKTEYSYLKSCCIITRKVSRTMERVLNDLVSFAFQQPWLFLQQGSCMHLVEKHTPVCMIHCHSCVLALLIIKLEFWSPEADDPSSSSQKSNVGESCTSLLWALLPEFSSSWRLGDSDVLKVAHTKYLEIQSTAGGCGRIVWRKTGSPNTRGYK